MGCLQPAGKQAQVWDSVGQHRTACSGDGRGCWQGWKAPAEPRSLSPWLWLMSLPPRPMMKHIVLMALEPHFLLESLREAGRCHTFVLHLASQSPYPTAPGSPEPCVRTGSPFPKLGMVRAWHLA